MLERVTRPPEQGVGLCGDAGKLYRQQRRRVISDSISGRSGSNTTGSCTRKSTILQRLPDLLELLCIPCFLGELQQGNRDDFFQLDVHQPSHKTYKSSVESRWSGGPKH